VDVATGSLGQGLPIGVGVAMAGQSLDRLPYRVWVLCGDSELAEGSIWEAAEQAGCSRLDNLTLIVDVNRLGQRGPTRHGWHTGDYAARPAWPASIWRPSPPRRRNSWRGTPPDGLFHSLAAGRGLTWETMCKKISPDCRTPC
jgi:hypothetical protein